jgi:two-component system phosphate regulon sensor histidine kinase PhoR
MSKKQLKLIILFLIILEALLTALVYNFWQQNFLPILGLIALFTFILAYAIIEKDILKKSLNEKENIDDLSTIDPDASVNEEVLDWAKDKENEIKQLKDNEKFRKEFIGNLAHELKTPIFNIQGYILTLLDGGWKDKKISRKYLERTERNINRLLNLVTDIDTISQLESGNHKMNMAHFNVVNLISEIFEMQEINCKKQNISLKYLGDFNTDEYFVHANEEKIFEVLLNLLENSIKYGIENGITQVRIYLVDKKVSIEVSDNGIGIAKENLQRIFERFYRVDKSRSREMGGSGLGLAIVKHIIEAHKEKISVKSKIGEGTIFTFTLEKGKNTLL